MKLTFVQRLELDKERARARHYRYHKILEQLDEELDSKVYKFIKSEKNDAWQEFKALEKEINRLTYKDEED